MQPAARCCKRCDLMTDKCLQEKRIFQIPWMHAARHGWDLEKDAPLFMRWAIHTGNTPLTATTQQTFLKSDVNVKHKTVQTV